MRSLPPLSQLRAFEAAARRMSFKDAAEELHVTPTAISHQVRALEAYCGRPLFRRRPPPLALTPAGHDLLATVKAGLDGFASALARLRTSADQRPLKVTATNAFASRWLVPRLPHWRSTRPDIGLEVIGTDDVLDLWTGEADIAVRYAHAAPPDLVAHELFRDRFYPICSPALLARHAVSRPSDLLRHSLIHCIWPATTRDAPTWARWSQAARGLDPDLPELPTLGAINFREELHAIEAVLAGQGISILSDVVVARDLAAGALVKAVDLPISGLVFTLVHIPGHPRQAAVDAFLAWIGSAR